MRFAQVRPSALRQDRRGSGLTHLFWKARRHVECESASPRVENILGSSQSDPTEETVAGAPCPLQEAHRGGRGGSCLCDAREKQEGGQGCDRHVGGCEFCGVNSGAAGVFCLWLIPVACRNLEQCAPQKRDAFLWKGEAALPWEIPEAGDFFF